MKKIILNAHPFFYTIVSLLIFYMQVRWETRPTEMLRPLAVLWIINMILFPIFCKLMGNLEWAGILLSIFVLCFYYSKPVFLVVFLSTVSTLLILVLVFWLLKKQFKVLQLSFTLTLVSLVFLIAQSIVVLKTLSSIPASYFEAMALRNESLAIPIATTELTTKPDIYYIILDSYASPYGLAEFYDYDNSEFINYLEEIGFVVPKDIYSNYPRTALSISSTLDMQYWDTISPNMDDVIFWWPVKPVLDNSRVRASLEAIGYKSISIASDWGLTNNTTTDLYYKPYPHILSEYENYILTSTPLKYLYSPIQTIAPVRTSEVHRRFISFNFETLKIIPEIQGSKFVVSHIIIPHPPFVFDEEGNPIGSDIEFTFGGPYHISKEEYRKGYTGQIQYLNTQLRSVINTILQTSEEEPIIILQADHGLNLYVDFSSADSGCLNERFSIFGAYYLPGRQQRVFPQDLTPVNLFRFIFNEYFSTNLELLENRQYYTKDHNLFAGMEDVTDQAMNSCVIPID